MAYATKMATKVGKYKKGGATKKFKVHKMYKGTKVETAKTITEHLALKKKGYTHTKPKAKKKK